MTHPEVSASAGRRALSRATQVLIVSSITFTFISYWRTAAVVLCDLASTAYYIGGIVEQAIGPAAPWFILAVMLFSYAVRAVYIESSALFVRGGVYRVVKQAMGGFLAKLSVSALMFDYLLTGPTSGVSAGSYIMGLLMQFINLTAPDLYVALHLHEQDPGQIGDLVRRWGAVLLAVLVTLYFFRQNLLGIHESSDKALKIMIATTVMAVIMLLWCLVTLLLQGPVNSVPWQPDLNKKWQHAERAVGDYSGLTDAERRLAQERERFFTPAEREQKVWILDPQQPDRLKPAVENGQKVPRLNEGLRKIGEVLQTVGVRTSLTQAQDDPLGFLGRFSGFDFLRGVGLLGLFIAFGHSILAMSGEETLAQVYREVESPKLKNFQRAAFIIFVYSVVLTGGISFLAVLLIPDEVRMKFYQDNLIGGLARHVLGPEWLKLLLEGFVVVVGFLILSGAVNTAIIGANGVLNRVAEDGVLPDWFLKPHPRYGTTYRVLILIAALQVGIILFSQGDIVILGEAYAFGVVWSFVFKALAMVVLRFTDKTPREYKVPLNLHLGSLEVPLGLVLIFLVLLITALLNFLTKEVATLSGVGFTLAFLTLFLVSEHYYERRRGREHQHLEQFNLLTTAEVSPASLGLGQKPYRKLVAIRSPQNLVMLEKALAETDPETTEIIVMTAKVLPQGTESTHVQLDLYDRQLMTAVVDRAERAGKQVHPLIVPTNNALHAILKTARDLGVQEVVLGASNKYSADEQLEQIGLYWFSLHEGTPAPLTVRIVGRSRDVWLDLAGGNRIPPLSARQARSVAELRAAGVGIDRVLLLHDGTPAGSDLFDAVLTLLDPQVDLVVAAVPLRGLVPAGSLLAEEAAVAEAAPAPGNNTHERTKRVQQACEQARRLGRELTLHTFEEDSWAERVRALAESDKVDLIVIPLPQERPSNSSQRWWGDQTQYLLDHAPCRIFLAAAPSIPQQPEEEPPQGTGPGA